MSNINRVLLSGRLTRDPELRTTAGGTTVLTISLANNERQRNQQTQQWEDYVNYIDCTCFGQRAEYIARNTHKGSLVAVAGRLRWQSWERDGQKRSKIEVLVDDVELFQPSQQQPAYEQQTYAPVYQPPQVQYTPQPEENPQVSSMMASQAPQIQSVYEQPGFVSQMPAGFYSEDVPF